MWNWLCAVHNNDDNFICITLSIRRYNVVAKAIAYYFLPLSIIGVLYALMARRLHISARESIGEFAGPQSRAQARARRHVARMVVTFVIGEWFIGISLFYSKCNFSFISFLFSKFLWKRINYEKWLLKDNNFIYLQFSLFAFCHTMCSCYGSIWIQRVNMITTHFGTSQGWRAFA